MHFALLYIIFLKMHFLCSFQIVWYGYNLVFSFTCTYSNMREGNNFDSKRETLLLAKKLINFVCILPCCIQNSQMYFIPSSFSKTIWLIYSIKVPHIHINITISTLNRNICFIVYCLFKLSIDSSGVAGYIVRFLLCFHDV